MTSVDLRVILAFAAGLWSLVLLCLALAAISYYRRERRAERNRQLWSAR